MKCIIVNSNNFEFINPKSRRVSELKNLVIKPTQIFSEFSFTPLIQDNAKSFTSKLKIFVATDNLTYNEYINFKKTSN